MIAHLHIDEAFRPRDVPPPVSPDAGAVTGRRRGTVPVLGAGSTGAPPAVPTVAGDGVAAGLVSVWDGGRWLRSEFVVPMDAYSSNEVGVAAAMEGLRLIEPGSAVRVFSDCLHLIRGMRLLVSHGAAAGQAQIGALVTGPAALWKALLDLTLTRRVEWRWNPGHAGIATNEYVHHLAHDHLGLRRRRIVKASGYEAWCAEHQLDSYEAGPRAFGPFQPNAFYEPHHAPVVFPANAPVLPTPVPRRLMAGI